MKNIEDLLFEKIISVCTTKTELNQTIRILRDYLENKYFKKGSKSASFPFKKLSPQILKGINGNSAYLYLKKIEKMANLINPYHLYIPFELKEAEIEKLGNWFKKNVGKNTILELHINPSLTLGAAISFKGVYRDFSLKYFIRNYYAEIGKLIDKYAQKSE